MILARLVVAILRAMTNTKTAAAFERQSADQNEICYYHSFCFCPFQETRGLVRECFVFFSSATYFWFDEVEFMRDVFFGWK